MLPFENLVRIDRGLRQPAYQQIASALQKHIRQGTIAPGLLLPGTREMARVLSVHRKTIIAAYDELAAQGWLEVEPKRGFRVTPGLPEVQVNRPGDPAFGPATFSTGFYRLEPEIPPIPVPAQAGPYRLAIDDGHPDPRLAPVELLLREYRSRFRRNRHVVRPLENGAAGAARLRETLSAFLAQTRGLQAAAANIMITHGAQMAIFLAARMLLRPGDVVLVGEPGYYVANQLFEELGASVVRVPVDDTGIDTRTVADICRKEAVRALYIVPHHHHPTTVTLSPERRMKLLALAREYDFAIIEDDYDFDFHYSSAPYLPLAASGGQDRVIYIGSFGKALTTTIRIGFMVAAADLIVQAAACRRLVELRGDTQMEEALAVLIENGTMARHLKKVNKIYRERRDLLCRLLEEQLGHVIRFSKPDGGMAVWTRFEPAFPLAAISDAVARKGLFMHKGTLFDSPGQSYHAIRFGFASLNEQELREAVSLIRQACDSLQMP
ncbi:PLP-dependent aminotransferase family protein [Pedobacter yulinensis]|uniref:PLP-dependent aminotransferase family protein n=1 Tax=Pedobacter yulinensis TaxID=2126353 RepID=A0A2T3HGW8_9SPHI|nr:PLP-dependent aminotransferase family protein [Pedobacter yulinensis]PST81688.1 PLP-dependent aminotransferase family protein [Pedobacter yulinensis]